MISLNPAKLNRCDWFIIVWVVYYLQGVLYPSGGALSIGLLGINLLVSIVCATKIWQMPNNPPYIKGLNLLVLMFSIYGFALILMNPSTVYYSKSGVSMASYNYIKSIYLSILPIYAFYYFSLKGYLTAKRLRWWAVVFCISSVVSYYYYMQQALIKLMERGSSAEETTNNAGYLFLSCIPLIVLFRKKPLIQFSLLAFVMAFIIMGMKRGAIAIGGVVVIYFIWKAIVNSRGKTKFALIVLSVCICVAAAYFFMYQMATSEYMMKRIEDTLEGNSSNRDIIYSFFWTYFTEKADALQYFIGKGANGTLEILGAYAHNDWLEIAINQGLCGIIVYAVYWKNFYSTWRQSTNIEAKTILALVGIIYFAKTLFSMSYEDMTYVCTSVFGYALATMNKENEI